MNIEETIRKYHAKHQVATRKVLDIDNLERQVHKEVIVCLKCACTIRE